MPGKDNLSNYMSRHPLKYDEKRNLGEEYDAFVSIQAVPNVMTLDDVKMKG